MRQPIRAQLLPPADLLVTLLCIASSPRVLFRYATASVWDRKVQRNLVSRSGGVFGGSMGFAFYAFAGGEVGMRFRIRTR